MQTNQPFTCSGWLSSQVCAACSGVSCWLVEHQLAGAHFPSVGGLHHTGQLLAGVPSAGKGYCTSRGRRVSRGQARLEGHHKGRRCQGGLHGHCFHLCLPAQTRPCVTDLPHRTINPFCCLQLFAMLARMAPSAGDCSWPQTSEGFKMCTLAAHLSRPPRAPSERLAPAGERRCCSRAQKRG